MLKRRITKAAEKAMGKMPDKHFCQIYAALEALRSTPEPTDSIALKGNSSPGRRRKDVGEYRIVYWFDDQTLYLDLIGKRNDDEIYKKSKRKGIL